MRTLPCLACVLLLTAATSFSARAQRPAAHACPGQPPAAVVRAYYRALVRGDKAGQLACFTPSYRQQLSAPNVVPEWNNVISLRITGLQVYTRAPGNQPWTQLLPGNVPPAYRAVQVIVRYVVRYRRVIDERNGPGIRFMYVVRVHRKSPWRIAGIGSGP